MFDSIRKLLGGTKATPPEPRHVAPPPIIEEDEPEPVVPELRAADLVAKTQAGARLYFLDVRELYEWNMTRVKASEDVLVQHIPMNSVPNRLADLPHDQQIAVICASGGRSYGVAHFLNENGFDAVNVDGGIGAWVRSGGAYEQGKA